MIFNATAVREGRYWVVTVDGVGVTQGRGAAEAVTMARDLVVAMKDLPAGDIDLLIDFQIEGIKRGEVAGVRRAVQDAAEAQERAAADSRRLAGRLLTAGLTGRDIAEVLGISPQRVSQLLRDRKAS